MLARATKTSYTIAARRNLRHTRRLQRLLAQRGLAAPPVGALKTV